MATVLRNLASPALQPPPINLELSLGSLFSDQHAAASEVFAAAHSEITGACGKEAVAARQGSCSIGNPENGAEYGSINAFFPALSYNTVNQAADINTSKGLQAQRWHAARKRRKGIIEEKLHKRLIKGELGASAMCSSMSRPCNSAGGTEWEVSDSYAPKSEYDTGNGDMFLHHGFRFGMPSAPVEQGMLPSDMAGLGMPSEVTRDISCDVKHNLDDNGDMSLPPHSTTSCTACGHTLSYGNALEGPSTSHGHSPKMYCAQCTQAHSGHLQKGQCVRLRGHTPRTLSLYTPQLAHYPVVANIPTAASSSSLCTAAFPERRREASGSIKGDDEDNQMGCHCSSSSGPENECSVRDMQSITSSDMEAQSSSCDGKSGRKGAVYKSTTELLGNSAAAHLYSLPAMPLASPYAIDPLQWGLSPPWFMQYPPHMAFGGSVPSPLMAAPLKEVTSLPQVLPRSPHLPLHKDKASNSQCPSVSIVGTSTTSENVTSKLSVDTGRQDPGLTGCTQAGKVEIDADVVPPMHAQRETAGSANAAMTDDQGLRVGAEYISELNRNEAAAVKAKGEHKLGQRLLNTSASDSTLPGDGCNRERASASGEEVDRGRRHSVLPASKRVSKKAKVVRFNSLDNTMQAAQPEPPEMLNSHGQSLSDNALEIAGSLTHSVSVDHSRSHSNCTSGVAELHSEVDQHPRDGGRTIYKALDECTSVNHTAGDNEMSYESEYNRENGHMHAEGIPEKKLHESGKAFADLPTVKTRGLGPNGKTIYGVMYITKHKQARLICRCHGKRMSPAEFVQHSGSNDLAYPERNILLSTLPSTS